MLKVNTMQLKNIWKALGANKPIHIGETGWAINSNEFYGNEGSKAADEYKARLFIINTMREWTTKKEFLVFILKHLMNHGKMQEIPAGSENHLGLFTVDGNAKYAFGIMV